MIVAISSPANAFTDECTQDPIYPVNPYENGYAASDCSLDGNGSLALIGEFGAPDLDPQSGLTSVGAALIFHHASGVWTEVQKIQHALPASNDVFGASVAVSGRFAIVSAPGRSSGVGGIFFFERDVLEPSSSQWSQFSEIGNPSGEVDGFGGSTTQHEAVAIDGSIAVVSAHLADGGTSVGSGRVYVYVYDVIQSQWVYETTLKPPYPDDTQECSFGYSVEIDGNRVIVGAPFFAAGTSGQYTRAGKAYVFTRTGPGASGWTLEGQLVSDSSDPSYEYLGWSVSIDGNAALVGAKGGTSSPAGFATVFAYSVSTHQWSSYADLNPSTTAIGFGFSVALSSSMAVVGAPFAGTDLSGRAFVYRRSSGAWNEVLILDSSSPSGPVDQLGATLALRGSQAIIGALGSSETSQMPKTGSVVFFGDLPDPDCQ
ncbi:MAG: hypothetical protein JNM94_06545 [Phycisphaerae bacterium]|nr:hypothetical protein [Phycisphaerae bacterium]